LVSINSVALFGQLLAARVVDRQGNLADTKAQEAQMWEAPSKGGEDTQEDSWKNLLK
jgi:hypothetical protein